MKDDKAWPAPPITRESLHTVPDAIGRQKVLRAIAKRERRAARRAKEQQERIATRIRGSA